MTEPTGSMHSTTEPISSLTEASDLQSWNDNQKKTCRGCGKLKSIFEFRKVRGGRLGRHSKCNECRNKQAREAYHLRKVQGLENKVIPLERHNDLNHPDVVTINYAVQHCYKEELKRSQLEDWARKELIVVFGPAKTIARKHLFWAEYIRVRYMAILVSRMGIEPPVATYLASELAKCKIVQNGRTWVEHRGLAIGVPIIEEQR